MATPAQIHANRLNAQKSTGPRSVDGKDAVRFNALKHGLDAASLIIPGEDPDELEELSREYRAQLRPRGSLARFLVETMISADWNQRRLARAEAAVINERLNAAENPAPNLGAVFAEDAAGPNALQKIFRRQQAGQRDWYRAIDQLRQLAGEGMLTDPDPEPEPEDLPIAAAAPEPEPEPISCPATASRTPQKGVIGFVPQRSIASQAFGPAVQPAPHNPDVIMGFNAPRRSRDRHYCHIYR